MSFDPTATYRSTQVASSSPAARIVLLYQGAIRFGTQHLVALDRSDRETAHRASIRCQAIVSGLQESLDLSVGPLATQLDQLYAFVLRRLADGNLTSDPGPTEEALSVLRGLLGTWQEIARTPVMGRPVLQQRPATGVMGTALS
jgi:flagellar protein FliS